MFFIYHQIVVQCLNISIYHLVMKIIRWWSTCHLPQLTIIEWTFSSLEFWVWQHLEDHWNKTQLHKLTDVHTVSVAHLHKHMINNKWIYPSVWLTWQVSKGYSTHLDTIFSHMDLCYSYRIDDTCRGYLRDILLFLFLLLTCPCSALTILIRFFMTYYCGWWCRVSTNLP